MLDILRIKVPWEPKAPLGPIIKSLVSESEIA
jgi:hypothetical protein